MDQSQEIGKLGTEAVTVALAAGVPSKDNSAPSRNDGSSRGKKKQKSDNSRNDQSSRGKKNRKKEDSDVLVPPPADPLRNTLGTAAVTVALAAGAPSKDNSAPSRNDGSSRGQRKKKRDHSRNDGSSPGKRKRKKDRRKRKRKDSDVLLPPPADPLRHTLVLDMDHTLLAARRRKVPKHEGSEYFKVKQPEHNGRGHKPYVYKRPGLHLFLTEMSKLYEMGVFTLSGKKRANSFLDVIDRDRQLIKFRLYRKSTDPGKSKDLSRLGRDLRKVIIIDDNPTSYRFQQSNAIPIKRFDGLKSDSELTALIPLLQNLSEVEDVRPVLSAKFHLDNRPVTDVNAQKSNGEEQCAAQKSNGDDQCADQKSNGEEQCAAQKSNGEEQCAAQKSNGDDQCADQTSNGEEQCAARAEI